LLFAAMGKSAQFPLHVWLPDAMAGPTPASALIHAATMVAAGVFLVARAMPIFQVSDSALDALTRRKLREEIRGLKKTFSFPIIYVTHDLNEAFFLADELISVVEGKIDKDWLKRTIQVESASPLPAPTVRLLRPTLAACLNKP